MFAPPGRELGKLPGAALLAPRRLVKEVSIDMVAATVKVGGGGGGIG